MGLLEEPLQPTPLWTKKIEAWDAFLFKEGLAQKTRQNYCWWATSFLAWLKQQEIPLPDLALCSVESSSAILHGKGRKDRCCPLWKETTAALRQLVAQRNAMQAVFCNRQGQALTRFGIHTLMERYTLKASVGMPTLRAKRVSPHTIRHTTAMHLLRSGVDINTIRVWLGHVSLQTRVPARP